MSKKNFTFEEFTTILTRVKACPNSRPLSPASEDPKDLVALTPGNFLIGTSISAASEPDVSDQDINLGNRRKRLKIISQYLCNRCTNWKYQKDNPSQGYLVVITRENYQDPSGNRSKC